MRSVAVIGGGSIWAEPRVPAGAGRSSLTEFSSAETPPDPRKWAHLERQASELGLPVRPPVADLIDRREPQIDRAPIAIERF